MQIKVFVSYTLRDKRLSKTKLNDLKNALKILNFLATYIDVLDNNNTIFPQNEVIDRLIDADVVWLIYTSDEVLKSEWVLKEIEMATEHNKIIHRMNIEVIDSIIYAKEGNTLLSLVKKYLH